MRFFVTANIKKNKPLYILVLFLLVFSLFYLVTSTLEFYSKYGFSFKSIFLYFYSDFEMPEKPSLALVSENIHISLFMVSFFLLINLSLFNLTGFSDRLKPIVNLVLSFFGFTHAISDFLIYLLGPYLIHLKLLSFLLFITLSLCLVLYTLLYFLFGEDKNPGLSLLRLSVTAFFLLSFYFIFFNFILFYSKMDFSIDGIINYYLGNPQLYTKPKTFEGLIKVVNPHTILIPSFVLTLAHFSSLTKSIGKVATVLAVVAGSVDNICGLLIRYVWVEFAYLKLLSFFTLQLSLTYICIYSLLDSFKD